MFLSGFSTTIMTYGQAGSGKTYAMFGDTKETGIVEQCCGYILNNFNASPAKCSFVEIFQEQVYDLLSFNGKIVTDEVRIKNGLEALHEEYIKNTADLSKIIKKSLKKIGGKSHGIFTLTIEKENPVKFLFVDLAGSERTKNNGKIYEKTKETSFVNKSLSVLGNVIKSISQNSKFINFRDSKLTVLLKESLMNSKLFVIETISSQRKNF